MQLAFLAAIGLATSTFPALASSAEPDEIGIVVLADQNILSNSTSLSVGPIACPKGQTFHVRTLTTWATPNGDEIGSYTVKVKLKRVLNTGAAVETYTTFLPFVTSGEGVRTLTLPAAYPFGDSISLVKSGFTAKFSILLGGSCRTPNRQPTVTFS